MFLHYKSLEISVNLFVDLKQAFLKIVVNQILWARKTQITQKLVEKLSKNPSSPVRVPK